MKSLFVLLFTVLLGFAVADGYAQGYGSYGDFGNNYYNKNEGNFKRDHTDYKKNRL